jgi:hypothetical protein
MGQAEKVGQKGWEVKRDTSKSKDKMKKRPWPGLV